MNQIHIPLDSRLLVVASAVGFVLMLVGLAGYIAEPNAAFQATFIVGVVLLVAGYTLLYLLGKKAATDYMAEESDEEENGFFYILDEDYSAPAGDATIEDLTRTE